MFVKSLVLLFSQEIEFNIIFKVTEKLLGLQSSFLQGTFPYTFVILSYILFVTCVNAYQLRCSDLFSYKKISNIFPQQDHIPGMEYIYMVLKMIERLGRTGRVAGKVALSTLSAQTEQGSADEDNNCTFDQECPSHIPIVYTFQLFTYWHLTSSPCSVYLGHFVFVQESEMFFSQHLFLFKLVF